MGKVQKINFSRMLRLAASVILCLLVLGLHTSNVQAATLSKENVTLSVGSTKTISLKSAKGSAKWKVSDKNVITMKKKSRYKVVITAVGEGEASLTVTNRSVSYTCWFDVIAKSSSSSSATSVSSTSSSTSSINSIDNCTIMQIGSNTPAYTGIAEIDYMVELYLRRAGVKEGMSEEEAVLKIWTFIAKNMRYQEDINKYGADVPTALKLSSSSVKNYQKQRNKLKASGALNYNAKKYVVKRAKYGSKIKIVSQKSSVLRNAMKKFIGKCTENSSVFTLMCNHIGIKAGKAAGKEYGADHTWSWAVVNGSKLYYDIGAAVHKMGRGKGFSTSKSIYAMKESAQAGYHLEMKISW